MDTSLEKLSLYPNSSARSEASTGRSGTGRKVFCRAVTTVLVAVLGPLPTCSGVFELLADLFRSCEL